MTRTAGPLFRDVGQPNLAMLDHHSATHTGFWENVLATSELDDDTRDTIRQHFEGRNRVPLGKILIQRGFMNLKQVSRLLQIQATEMTMRIGDLAVREGYCTPRQLREAIDVQHALNFESILELIATSQVDANQLVEGLLRYVHHLEAQQTPTFMASGFAS